MIVRANSHNHSPLTIVAVVQRFSFLDMIKCKFRKRQKRDVSGGKINLLELRGLIKSKYSNCKSKFVTILIKNYNGVKSIKFIARSNN